MILDHARIIIHKQRGPNEHDSKNYQIGDMWFNESTQTYYVLTRFDNNKPVWAKAVVTIDVIEEK